MRLRRTRTILALLVAGSAPALGCSGSPPAPAERVSGSSALLPSAMTSSAPPSASSAALVASSATVAASSGAVAEPPPAVREVAEGYAVEPREPVPRRPEMAGQAALVWQTIPAPPNPSGPTERDLTVTRYVLQKDGHAELVAERGEALFASGASLWHLTARDVPVVIEDCDAGGKRVRRVHRQLVFESLEKKPRVVEPMKAHVASGEWARLDLVAMVGPWVAATIDHYSASCEGRPVGSAYRVVVDLDQGKIRPFDIPAGALERYRPLVRDVLAHGCSSGGDEIRADGAGFHYDQAGRLVVDYDFSSFTAPVCFHGVAHVFVGTYELLPQLEPHGQLPTWLQGYLKEHPSRGVSLIAAGREDAARTELEGLPKVAPELPRDSLP